MFISFPEGYSDGIYITRFFHAVFHASPFGLSNRSRGPNRNKKKIQDYFVVVVVSFIPTFRFSKTANEFPLRKKKEFYRLY